MSQASDNISPTAHYTGYVWYHYGLSHPALVTPQGQWLYAALTPLHALSCLTGAPGLRGVLLGRHQSLDLLLHRAIQEGRVSQVIEVAAGLSPRGWRFKQRYGDSLHYIEADLPEMALRKRALLSDAGLIKPGHEVLALDALADEGPLSLAHLASVLNPACGTAIITEGLVNYFDQAHLLGIWGRFAKVLSGFANGVYLSDIHLAHANQGMGIAAFRLMLSAFVKGEVHFHFDSEEQACQALVQSGFAQARLHAPSEFAKELSLPLSPGADMVRIIEARVQALPHGAQPA
jgi:O-methyltransferase involved in polyketide biosynthesis